MKRACSLFSILLLTLLLNGCGSSDDKTDTTTGTGDDQTTTTKSDFTKHETFSATGFATESGRGGGTTFRIMKKGPEFGKKIKVVFSSGYTVIVPDTSRRFSVGCFIFRPGGGSYRNPATWTAHKGVFLVAPAGDKSPTVTIWY